MGPMFSSGSYCEGNKSMRLPCFCGNLILGACFRSRYLYCERKSGPEDKINTGLGLLCGCFFILFSMEIYAPDPGGPPFHSLLSSPLPVIPRWTSSYSIFALKSLSIIFTSFKSNVPPRRNLWKICSPLQWKAWVYGTARKKGEYSNSLNERD